MTFAIVIKIRKKVVVCLGRFWILYRAYHDGDAFLVRTRVHTLSV